MYNPSGRNHKLLPRILLIVLCLALLGILLLRRGAEKRADFLPAATPTPEPTAAAAEPAETPKPTDAPTPTPVATEEPEASEDPGEETPSPTPIVSQTGGVGAYTWTVSEDEQWTLTLRENGTYTLMDPSGCPHTGESWSVEEDGTVRLGPTDLYDVDWTYTGGCSHWYFPSWQQCAPVR